MFRRFTKKRVLIALSAVAALAIASVAFAYLTASGSGSGSGDVSATASNMALTITSAPPLTKIGDTETYEISAHNPGTSPEKVSGISVTSITPSAAATTAGCPASTFTAGAPTMTGNEVPAGGDAVVGHVAVTFNDNSSQAQNGCLGTGTVSISLSST